MHQKFKIGECDALLVVDVQNDFCFGGALAVQGGDEVVPIPLRAVLDDAVALAEPVARGTGYKGKNPSTAALVSRIGKLR